MQTTECQYSQKTILANILMQNIVGMRVEDAIFVLEKHGLQVLVQSESDIVYKQLPAPNTSIRKNSIVLIE